MIFHSWSNIYFVTVFREEFLCAPDFSKTMQSRRKQSSSISKQRRLKKDQLRAHVRFLPGFDRIVSKCRLRFFFTPAEVS